MAASAGRLLLILLGLLSIQPATSQLINLEEGLVACYLFNGTADDVSGNLNHGTVVGPVLTADRFNNENSAFYFDGVDDYIVVEDADMLSFPSQEFSIAFWLDPYSLDHSFWLYKGSDRSNREYAFGLRPDKLASVHISNEGSADVQYGTPSNTTIKLSEWVHIVGTWDGSFLSIYINGHLENQLIYSAIVGNYDSDLFIGTFGGAITEYAFQGVIDDIYIYNRVINLCEIEALYSGMLLDER